MRKTNKKGFTIVELVIVIAVIAILAAVLIPTFAGIVKKANDSAMDQELNAARTVLLAEEDAQLDTTATYYFIYVGKTETKWFTLDSERNFVETTKPAATTAATADTVYAADSDANTEVTLTADDTTTTTVNEATKTVYDADFKNVIIWKKAA